MSKLTSPRLTWRIRMRRAAAVICLLASSSTPQDVEQRATSHQNSRQTPPTRARVEGRRITLKEEPIIEQDCLLRRKRHSSPIQWNSFRVGDESAIVAVPSVVSARNKGCMNYSKCEPTV